MAALTSENTVDQHQQMTWQPKSSLTVETLHWTSSNVDSVPLHSSSRLWDLDFQMKCTEHSTKEHTVQLFFFLAQVRCFWQCFCFRSGLVALFLKMTERGDSWCTDSNFSSLLVKLSQCVLIGFAWQCSQACGHLLLLVHIFLPNFFFSVNLCIYYALIQHSLNITPFSNYPLWLTLFVEDVNDRLLDQLPSQQCPPLLWIQRIRNSFIETQM